MVRIARFEDIPRIAEINIYGWRDSYRGIVSDDFLFKQLSVGEAIKKTKTRFIKHSGIHLVYEDGTDKIIKGMAVIGNCRDEDMPAGFELMAIYVEKYFLRCGIGSEFIKYFEKEAERQNKKELCIWVFEKNNAARNFYEYCGYAPDGTTKLIEPLNALEMRYIKTL